MFFITCLWHFLAAGTCLSMSWGLPPHSSQKSVLTGSIIIWSIDSGISYTGSIFWRIADSSIYSMSTLLWMDDKASSPCWRPGVPIDPGIQKAWIILHSFTPSFRYIHIYDRNLPQSFQVPCSTDNTIHTCLQFHA